MISAKRDDIMGMPITVTIVDAKEKQKDIDEIFLYFQDIDNRFSTYKKDSEISKFNRGEIKEENLSKDMKDVFQLSEQTKNETDRFFDIRQPNGTTDPSGLVKGWAIWQASKILEKRGYKNFYIDAGGDVQVSGLNKEKKKWRIGIKNPFSAIQGKPFNQQEIIKIVALTNKGIATSGTYIRGQHVYNPNNPSQQLGNVVSLTVIGPNVYEADRFATAAFAMQEKGIYFLEKQKNLEGYMIDKDGIATMTSGFEKYVMGS